MLQLWLVDNAVEDSEASNSSIISGIDKRNQNGGSSLLLCAFLPDLLGRTARAAQFLRGKSTHLLCFAGTTSRIEIDAAYRTQTPAIILAELHYWQRQDNGLPYSDCQINLRPPIVHLIGIMCREFHILTL
jgi:hypothetical protein